METKLQTQINTIQEKQDNEMKHILDKFETSMKLMVTNMNTMMESRNKTIIDLSNPQRSSEQAVQHLIPIRTLIPHGGLHHDTVPSPSKHPNNTLPLSKSTQESSGVGVPQDFTTRTHYSKIT
eukprot:scaffold91518_cov33-Attheya_sp.AAC.8